MEKFRELRDSASKKIQIADYVLTTTYPLVKDPKLFIRKISSIVSKDEAIFR